MSRDVTFQEIDSLHVTHAKLPNAPIEPAPAVCSYGNDKNGDCSTRLQSCDGTSIANNIPETHSKPPRPPLRSKPLSVAKSDATVNPKTLVLQVTCDLCHLKLSGGAKQLVRHKVGKKCRNRVAHLKMRLKSNTVLPASATLTLCQTRKSTKSRQIASKSSGCVMDSTYSSLKIEKLRDNNFMLGNISLS